MIVLSTRSDLCNPPLPSSHPAECLWGSFSSPSNAFRHQALVQSGCRIPGARPHPPLPQTDKGSNVLAKRAETNLYQLRPAQLLSSDQSPLASPLRRRDLAHKASLRHTHKCTSAHFPPCRGAGSPQLSRRLPRPPSPSCWRQKITSQAPPQRMREIAEKTPVIQGQIFLQPSALARAPRIRVSAPIGRGEREPPDNVR